MFLTHGLLALSMIAARADATVSVDYAGSLVATMEGPIARAFLAERGIRFEGEGKGSKAIANLIAAGLRTPDVFISADPKLLAPLRSSELISTYAVLGSARMVIAFSSGSPHAALLSEAARGSRSILDVLAAPALRVGRTDPALDPKGVRTIHALRLLGAQSHRSNEAERVLRQSQTFPEEDLAVRVESGELDAGFFYSTETVPMRLKTIELPARANLSNEIVYAIATLTNAPHPQAARAFVDFLLRGSGRGILEHAGLRMFR